MEILKFKLLATVILICGFTSFINAQQLYTDFEWKEAGSTESGWSPGITIAVGESYQLSFNSSPYSTEIFKTSNWVYKEVSGNTYAVVNTPTCLSIDDKGVVTGLKAGRFSINPTGYIIAKTGTQKNLYIDVIAERKESESNNTLSTANEITSKIRFGLSNTSDIDYFKFKAKLEDNVTFKIHYYGTRETPFGYKWATFSGMNTQIGSGSLTLQDQECNVYSMSNGYCYLEIYYDQNRTQYFNYGEEFVAEVYVNGMPTAVEKTKANDSFKEEETTHYDLSGKIIDKKSQGLHIIKNKKGNVRKVLVK